MMNLPRWMLIPLLIALLGCGGADVSKVVRSWSGTGTPDAQWCRAESVRLSLSIHADGTVTGRIGDASLVDATIGSPKQPPMGLKPRDYLIKGGLTGKIISAEDIQREEVMISLGLDEASGRLEGEMATDGSRVGGPQEMRFRLKGITLR